MTENKAIQILNNLIIEGGDKSRAKVAIDIAIQALEEIQAYRAIGTVEDIQEVMKSGAYYMEIAHRFQSIGTIEEFKALKEKNAAKIPNYEGDGYYHGQIVLDTWICPNCGKSYEVDYDDYDYCPNCGQHIDHSTLTEDD